MTIARFRAFWGIAALFAAAFASPAIAQGISQKVAVCDPAYVNRCVKPDTSGALPVTFSGSGTLASQVQGNSPSGVADVGNPVMVAGQFNSTLPTFVDGQRGDVQISSRGLLLSTSLNNAAATDGFANSNVSSQSSLTNATVIPGVGNSSFNGTTWDRARTVQGADGTGLGVTAVATAPISAAAGSLTPTVSAAVTGGVIYKASAGNLYSVSATAGASAGFLLLFNSTTIPVDGAVTPQQCIPIAANGQVTYDATRGGIPERFTVGIVGVFSTTGCYTKTISATAFLRAQFQ